MILLIAVRDAAACGIARGLIAITAHHEPAGRLVQHPAAAALDDLAIDHMAIRPDQIAGGQAALDSLLARLTRIIRILDAAAQPARGGSAPAALAVPRAPAAGSGADPAAARSRPDDVG